jgi:ribonuclease D
LTASLPLPIEMVTQSAQLSAAIRGMDGSAAIALDTESNSSHYYPEQLCLIQIATRNRAYVIDTIVHKDAAPLGTILADSSIMKVIHGADYDIRCLDRHYGFRVQNLYDTHIAARFAGLTEVGLAALLRDLLGINIVKSHRLQTADWGRRPLSIEAIDYAASDVCHLLSLQEILDKKLQALGRTTWAAEEFTRLEEVRYTPPDLERAFLSVKGADDLDGRGLAILRSLFLFRDEEARRQHRPPFFIMPDIALVSLAAAPTTDGMGPGLQRYRRGIQQALHDGLSAPPVQAPPPPMYEPSSPEQIKRLSRLKVWRAELAKELNLDPSLLWPTVSIQRLAREPASFDMELNSPGIRRWQREQFAASLQKLLTGKVS